MDVTAPDEESQSLTPAERLAVLEKMSRPRVRGMAIGNGVLMILLVLATIPLNVLSVRQQNFPGSFPFEYLTFKFYWTDAMVSININDSGIHVHVHVHECSIN